ncbi:DEAD/DEAH box helicase [Latilactobacillus sakei]
MGQPVIACGRQFTAAQLADTQNNNYSLPQIERRPAFLRVKQRLICQRCQQVVPSQTCLPDGRHYCAQCLLFGRLVEGDWLYTIPEDHLFKTATLKLTWAGQLTVYQEQAAQAVVAVIQAHKRHVLTAVTGAGKTEMLFQGILVALQKGQRVCLAAPRVAVCLELYPRLQAAFATTSIMLMHGEQTEPYRYTQLVICTTHQLLKFYHAFDTVIVDEVDAFPFVDNPVLATAVEQACKPQCALLYLTATPTPAIKRAIAAKQMTVSELPLRFHGGILPEPQRHVAFNWRPRLKKGRLPKRLEHDCQICLKNQQILLFVPQVRLLKPVANRLSILLPAVRIETVHANDPEQIEKIAAFRAQQIQLMVTTTILERGVTFKNVAVLVLGAEHMVFNEAVLVQIAGRAGRHKDYTQNPVHFYYQDYTRAIKGACRQIKAQNQRGRRLQSTV